MLLILCADSTDDRTDLDDGRHVIDQLLGGKLAANVGSAIEDMYHALLTVAAWRNLFSCRCSRKEQAAKQITVGGNK